MKKKMKRIQIYQMHVVFSYVSEHQQFMVYLNASIIRTYQISWWFYNHFRNSIFIEAKKNLCVHLFWAMIVSIHLLTSNFTIPIYKRRPRLKTHVRFNSMVLFFSQFRFWLKCLWTIVFFFIICTRSIIFGMRHFRFY